MVFRDFPESSGLVLLESPGVIRACSARWKRFRFPLKLHNFRRRDCQKIVNIADLHSERND